MVSLKEAYNVKQCVKVRSVQYKTSLAELIIHWGSSLSALNSEGESCLACVA